MTHRRPQVAKKNSPKNAKKRCLIFVENNSPAMLKSIV